VFVSGSALFSGLLLQNHEAFGIVRVEVWKMVTSIDAVKIIDAKIMETEKELEKLRRAAELLPVVSSDLMALRRTRALLLGEDPDTDLKPTPPPAMNGHHPTQGRGVSAAQAMMETIRAAGTPLHAKDITSTVNGRGFQITRATAEGQLARWVKEGKLVRTAPSTFALVR
jgi:hypothetical protein